VGAVATDIRRFLQFRSDLRRWRALGGAVTSLMPIYRDRHKPAAQLGEYFHQDLWAARRVVAAKPPRHVDVGSRIDGFLAHLLPYMEVEVVDMRPLANGPAGLRFTQADATTMAGFPDDSLPSLSSLHAAEHFGLGRYGDPVDPGAHIKFMRSLQRVLAPGGRLYFGVPMYRRDQVYFNAHRFLSMATVMGAFDALTRVSFGLVTPDGCYLESAAESDVERLGHVCGLFEFKK